MKKILAVLLCLALLGGAVPNVFAQEQAEQETVTKQEAVIEQARRSYQRSRGSAGKDSFQGLCGLMTSHQLYNLGINSSCIIQDGKNQFDYYQYMTVTSGGYYIKACCATDYSLLGALNHITRNGTVDAYNLMVGFQWTNTEAGGQYGHSVLINAILDGTVYFVESYTMSLNGMHPEGSVITCSIAEFVEYFDSRTVFDGIICFGSGQYSDACDFVGTDLFLQTRFESVLRSQPCLVGENGCTRLRSIAPGERLRATGIFTTPDGQLFYRIDEGERIGFIAASAVTAVRVNAEELSIENVQIPEFVYEGEDFGLVGTVTARYGTVDAVELRLTDSTGQLLFREQAQVEHAWGELSLLDELTRFDLMEQGVYQLEIYARCASPVVTGDGLENRYETARLWGQVLQVGGKLRNAKAQPVIQGAMPQVHDGWVWEDGKWYLYRYGRACTGWVSYCGVDYYLDENGAALTGWQNIDGWLRYFSATGAMVTGWLTLDGITTYHREDGVAVAGWVEIGTGLYYFAEDGTLVTGGEMTKDDVSYMLGEDGRAEPKTQE